MRDWLFERDFWARAIIAAIILVIAATLGSCAEGTSIARYCLTHPGRC